MWERERDWWSTRWKMGCNLANPSRAQQRTHTHTQTHTSRTSLNSFHFYSGFKFFCIPSLFVFRFFHSFLCFSSSFFPCVLLTSDRLNTFNSSKRGMDGMDPSVRERPPPPHFCFPSPHARTHASPLISKLSPGALKKRIVRHAL